MRSRYRLPLPPDAASWCAQHSGRQVRDVVASTSITYRVAAAPWERRFARHFYPEQQHSLHTSARMWIVLELAEDAALAVRNLIVENTDLVVLCTHTTDAVDVVAIAVDVFDVSLATTITATCLALHLSGVAGARFEVDQGAVIGEGGDVAAVLALCLAAVPDNPSDCLAHLGVEAARECLLRQLTLVLAFDGSYVNSRHLGLLADSMCYAGDLCPMNRYGLARRGGTVIEAASFETATTVLVKGAVEERCSDLVGVSEAILLGRLAPLGTGLNQLHLDEEALCGAFDHSPQSPEAPPPGIPVQWSPVTPWALPVMSPVTGEWSPTVPVLDFGALFPPAPPLLSPTHYVPTQPWAISAWGL